jgi:hypothetical protein
MKTFTQFLYESKKYNFEKEVPPYMYLEVDKWQQKYMGNRFFPCDDWDAAQFRVLTPKTKVELAINIQITGKEPKTFRDRDGYWLRVKVIYLDEDGKPESNGLGWIMLEPDCSTYKYGISYRKNKTDEYGRRIGETEVGVETNTDDYKNIEEFSKHWLSKL